MARPKKEIPQDIFEGACEIQCTLEEMAGLFNCDTKTIEAWCKRTYSEGFSAVYKKKSACGKTSLRRYQYNLARTNPSMAIWLGKQWLGQKDSPDSDNAPLEKLDAIIQAISKEADRTIKEAVRTSEEDHAKSKSEAG